MRLQSKCQLDYTYLKAWLGMEDLPSIWKKVYNLLSGNSILKFLPFSSKWLRVVGRPKFLACYWPEASVTHYTGLSPGSPECLHVVAATSCRERESKKKLLGLYDLVLEVTRHHLLHSVHQKEVIKYSTYSREGELGFTFWRENLWLYSKITHGF